MIELIGIFFPNILAGGLASMALALLGCFVAARDKAVQTLVLSQGAVFGVLVGMIFSATEHESGEIGFHTASFFFAVAMAAIFYGIGEWLTRSIEVTKNSYFIALFALLMALNYLTTALFPSLENHMTQVFFGDLTTLTKNDAFVTVIISTAVFVLSLKFIRTSIYCCFEEAVFGTEALTVDRKRNLVQIVMNVTGFFFLCYMVQFLGFLFTMISLFVPTTVVSLMRVRSLYSHFTVVILAGLGGSCLGFLLSLYYPRLPTVPTIAFTIAIVAAFGAYLERNR